MKKLLSLIVALFAVLPVFAYGFYDFEVDGIYYKKLSDNFNGVEAIDGKGGVGVYHFTIPETVTYNNITYAVTSIGEYAFEGHDIKSVSIGNLVYSIGYGAFRNCNYLTSVSIGNSVNIICDQAFSGCEALESVYIPSSVANIGNAFRGCSSLISVDVDSENTAFCSIEGVVYSKDMKKIIIYPGGRQGSFDIPEFVTEIGTSAFADCGGLTSINIPNSVTYIMGSAFSDCSGLTSVSIPNSVTYIGSHAFNGCSRLTSVSIPNSVTYIADFAFYNCRGLTSVYIGENVSKIGSQAFYRMGNIEEITVSAVVPPAANNYYSTFDSSAYTNATLCVPKESIEAYKTTEPWSNFRTIKTLDESGVNAVSENSEAVFDICSVNGVLLKRAATQADVDALAPGLYIVGGKKLLVK